MNIALGGKLYCWIREEKDKLWSRLLQAEHLLGGLECIFLQHLLLPIGSSILNFIKSWSNLITSNIFWKLERGIKIRFWRDGWLDDDSLKEDSKFKPLPTLFEEVLKVSDYWEETPMR